MKKILLIFFLLFHAEVSLAKESFRVEIQSFKNGIFREQSRIESLLGIKAKKTQISGEYYLSREVLFESSSDDSVTLKLVIEEHLYDATFDLSEISQIRKDGGFKELSITVGGNIYTYKIALHKVDVQ